jgi:hypothetical protein
MQFLTDQWPARNTGAFTLKTGLFFVTVILLFSGVQYDSQASSNTTVQQSGFTRIADNRSWSRWRSRVSGRRYYSGNRRRYRSRYVGRSIPQYSNPRSGNTNTYGNPTLSNRYSRRSYEYRTGSRRDFRSDRYERRKLQREIVRRHLQQQQEMINRLHY